MDTTPASVRCPVCDAVQSGALAVCLDCGGPLAQEERAGGALARLKAAIAAAWVRSLRGREPGLRGE